MLIHLKKLQSALGLRKNITLESRELLFIINTLFYILQKIVLIFKFITLKMQLTVSLKHVDENNMLIC